MRVAVIGQPAGFSDFKHDTVDFTYQSAIRINVFPQHDLGTQFFILGCFPSRFKPLKLGFLQQPRLGVVGTYGLQGLFGCIPQIKDAGVGGFTAVVIVRHHYIAEIRCLNG